MSWNEPGGDNKDPWSGRNDQNSPPDLDEALRSLQDKLGRILGGGSGSGGSDGASMRGFGLLAAGAAVLWGLSGFYIVDEGTRGVVTRFGAYVDTTTPGLNWHIPAPIEQVQVVDVEKQQFIEGGYRSGSGRAMGSV
ncbi:MAG: protease modulator HflK N-terminal domain-containing protein, partial [Methylomonas sp.]|nr:protease modulator HflK N-terminal domain-containing protein [Methylomonas sp.]